MPSRVGYRRQRDGGTVIERGGACRSTIDARGRRRDAPCTAGCDREHSFARGDRRRRCHGEIGGHRPVGVGHDDAFTRAGTRSSPPVENAARIGYGGEGQLRDGGHLAAAGVAALVRSAAKRTASVASHSPREPVRRRRRGGARRALRWRRRWRRVSTGERPEDRNQSEESLPVHREVRSPRARAARIRPRGACSGHRGRATERLQARRHMRSKRRGARPEGRAPQEQERGES